MQAVLPVILALQADPCVDVHVFFMEPSRTLLKQFNICGKFLESGVYNRDPVACIRAVLDETMPDLVVSGSSPARGMAPETPEQHLILESRRRGIRSLGILDTWGLYRERFASTGDSIDVDLVPDRLCVLDQLCLDELTSLGIPVDRMLVTHNPWLDQFARIDMGSAPILVNGERDGWRILYVSQPLSENRKYRNWPYDQEDVLFGLLQAITRASKSVNNEVIIWAHPAEDPRRWRELSRFEQAGLRLIVDADRSRSIISAVDFVVTSHSTVIYEALQLDTPCISFRPDGHALDTLVTERLSLSPTFTDVDGLCVYLRNIDSHAERRRLSEVRRSCIQNNVFYNDGKATDRVTNEIRRMLAERMLRIADVT